MKREFGGNLLKLLFFLGCAYGIIRVSIWSYFQTQAFFAPFDVAVGRTEISNALALIFQYGQNITLFLASIEKGRQLAYKNKIVSIRGNNAHVAILEEEISKSKVLSTLMYILFGAFALVDAGTNLGQFFETTYQTATSTWGISPFALYIFAGVGIIVSVVVVFVEEFFMKAANSVLHAFNDVLESLGIKRISSFDLFVDPDKIIATRLEEQGRSGAVSSYATGQGQTLSKKQKPQMPQTRQMPISGSATNGKVTRPAFQQPKAAMIDDDDEGSIPSFVSRESSSIKKEPPPYHPVGMYASHSKNRERLDLE